MNIAKLLTQFPGPFSWQMDSLGLSVTDYFLLDQLRIYPVGIEEDVADTRKSFSLLTQHIAEQASSRVVDVDSLPPLGGQSSGDEIIDFPHVFQGSGPKWSQNQTSQSQNCEDNPSKIIG